MEFLGRQRDDSRRIVKLPEEASGKERFAERRRRHDTRLRSKNGSANPARPGGSECRRRETG